MLTRGSHGLVNIAWLGAESTWVTAYSMLRRSKVDFPAAPKGGSSKHPEPRATGGQASLCIAWLQDSSSWLWENRKQSHEEAEIETHTWLLESRLTDYLLSLGRAEATKDTARHL